MLVICSNCNHKVQSGEHYVELENGETLDETCFFEYAIDKLKAKEKKFGFVDFEDWDD